MNCVSSRSVTHRLRKITGLSALASGAALCSPSIVASLGTVAALSISGLSGASMSSSAAVIAAIQTLPLAVVFGEWSRFSTSVIGHDWSGQASLTSKYNETRTCFSRTSIWRATSVAASPSMA